MSKVTRFMLILVALLFMGFVAVRYAGVPTSWAPPSPGSEIAGTTPFEKVPSMVAYLNNQKGNDFAKVYFDSAAGYEPNSRVWRYGIAADHSLFSQPRTLQEQQEKQQKIELYWSIIKDLFVNTAQWDETARGVIVTVVFPTPLDDSVYGFVYLTDDVGIANIRKYPTEWVRFTNTSQPEKFFGIPESVLQKELQKASQQGRAENPNKEGGE